MNTVRFQDLLQLDVGGNSFMPVGDQYHFKLLVLDIRVMDIRVVYIFLIGLYIFQRIAITTSIRRFEESKTRYKKLREVGLHGHLQCAKSSWSA